MVGESERRAWVCLALMPYIGADTFLQLIRHFGSVQAAWSAPLGEVRAVLTRKTALSAWQNRRGEAESAAEAAFRWAEQSQCRLLLLCDEAFPEQLSEGMTPPPLLFVRGNYELLRRPSFSIVGCRHATPSAMRTAFQFAQALSERGITVVSGMASGVDTAAHQGALTRNGATVAVWGTGIDRVYPAENRPLAHEIADKGLIISEFPLGTAPIAGNFPRRNRLIAALSQGTLVVEAAVESGSLITARLAAEMGREVMAVPGSIDNPLSKGCHKLIKDGAKLVECLEDILQECPRLQTASSQTAESGQSAVQTAKGRNPRTTKAQSTATPEKTLPETAALTEIHSARAPDKPERLPETVKPSQPTATESAPNAEQNGLPDRVLHAMGFAPTHPDVLAEQLAVSAAQIYEILLELELADQVAAMPGGRYQRLR